MSIDYIYEYYVYNLWIIYIYIYFLWKFNTIYTYYSTILLDTIYRYVKICRGVNY